MKKIIIAGLVIAASTQAKAQAFKTRKDSVSYALGITMAETLKKSGISEYNEDLVKKAISEHLAGKGTFDAATADKIYKEEAKKIADKKLIETKKAGEEFLANNKKSKLVQSTPSGLQYKHTQEGTGAMPDGNDKVTVHYHGTLIDGTVFDSSVQRGTPATFGLNQVIPGWTEGLQYMKEGGKTTFYIPSELAYGSRTQNKIPGNSTLIFEVELIKVEPVEGTGTPKPGAPAPAAPTKK
ncbi:MAG: FKBP-type peptidyl-prolyl cis-trans isomerase [Flavobacteriales bacterium]|jgi:FKBP-type peptidyl-prolyl cis-trans isomerase